MALMVGPSRCSALISAPKPELHVSQAAVSRHVRLLEDQLGRPLFRRLHRAVELTAAGGHLASALTTSFATIHRAVETARRTPFRRLRISVEPAVARIGRPRLRQGTRGFRFLVYCRDQAADRLKRSNTVFLITIGQLSCHLMIPPPMGVDSKFKGHEITAMKTSSCLFVSTACLMLLSACATAGNRPQSAMTRNPDCPVQTGGKLTNDSPQCAPSGSSYSEEDLRRTGRTNAADALQVLDPSVTVRR